MNCPHGNGPASMCSQCLGVKVERVAFAEGTQVVRNAEPTYGTMALTKTRTRCTYCRKAGHVEDKCRDKRNAESVATALLQQTDVHPRR